MTLAKLKAQAEQLGCSVEDDRENTTLYVHAPDGKGWDEGQLTSLVHPYGSCGSYLPAWRIESLKDASTRLAEMGRPECDVEEC
jgi:hypothetical protein